MDQSTPVRGDTNNWEKLAQACAQGAIYDSNERQPHSKCLPGTRVDVLEDLEDLVDDKARKVVWISGESGSGKSSIAHTLADRLRDKGKLAATFFFSRKHTKRSTFDHVLITLAYQLGSQHHQAREVIVKAISDDPALLSPEKSRRDQLESLVFAPLRQVAHAWKDKEGISMIFDALDEGTANSVHDIRHFIPMLFGLIRDLSLPIHKIIITSRLWPQIRRVMLDPDFADVMHVVSLDTYNSRQDVESFFRHAFDQIYEDHGLADFFCPKPWPPEDDILMLSNQANGRFIFAATLVRLIDQDEPQYRLRLVCSMLRGSVEQVWGNIDHLYASVIDGIESTARDQGIKYLSLIIHLAEPLSLSGLRLLFGADIHSCLLPFSALVSVPSPDSPSTVQIYHSSFRDFLLQMREQNEQSQADLSDSATYHHQLSSFCFRTMAGLLKRDLCGLEDPSLLHTEIPDFQRRRDAIPHGLQYCCKHWVYHLQRRPAGSEAQGQLLDFVEKRLLFAIEAYSLLGELSNGADLLKVAWKAVVGWPAYSFPQKEYILALLRDIRQMVLQFFEPISASALHVYESALPFCPARSQVRLTYKDVEPTGVTAEQDFLDDDWDCVTRVIDTKQEYLRCILSPDGSQVVARHIDGFLRAWDTTSGLLVTTVFLEKQAKYFTHIAHNGSVVSVIVDAKQCALVNLTNGTLQSLHVQPKESLHDTSVFSYDGTRLFLASFHLRGTGHSILVYSVSSCELLSLFSIGSTIGRFISTMALSCDEGFLAIHSHGHVNPLSRHTQHKTSLVDLTACQTIHRSIDCCDMYPDSCCHPPIVFSPENNTIWHIAEPLSSYSYSDFLEIHEANAYANQDSPVTEAKPSPLEWMPNPSKTQETPGDGPHIVRPELIRYANQLVGFNICDKVAGICTSSHTHWKTKDERCIGVLYYERQLLIIDLDRAASTSSFDAYPPEAYRLACISQKADLKAYVSKIANNIDIVCFGSPTHVVYSLDITDSHCVVQDKENMPICYFSPSSAYFIAVFPSRLDLWDIEEKKHVGFTPLPFTWSHSLSLPVICFSKDEIVFCFCYWWSLDEHDPLAEGSCSLISVWCGEDNKLEELGNVGWNSGSIVTAPRLRYGAFSVTSDVVEWCQWVLSPSYPRGYSVTHYRWRRGSGAIGLVEKFRLPKKLEGTHWLEFSPNFRMIYLRDKERKAQYVMRPSQDGYFVCFDYIVDNESFIDIEYYSSNTNINRSELIPATDYILDTQIDKNTFFDTRSWSDLCIDSDGWFRQRQRRICWLPVRYRPIYLKEDGLELLVDGNKVTILHLKDSGRITMRLLNTTINFFDQ